VLRWSYLAEADRAAVKKGDPAITVVVPPSGRLAVPFIGAIPKTAPHPSAARLWQEHLLADEGQAAIAAAGCHPIRLDDLVARDVLPPETLDRLADARGAMFPTAAQLAAATDAIQTGWGPTVGMPIR
jgi:putative spermidine/putrescine transport system substrate-binding protein